jgi:hypothetical protein
VVGTETVIQQRQVTMLVAVNLISSPRTNSPLPSDASAIAATYQNQRLTNTLFPLPFVRKHTDGSRIGTYSAHSDE